MTRDRDVCPTIERAETSKLTVTVHGSRECAIDTQKGLFVVAGCLVLAAAVLSFVAPPLAGPVGYVGVGLGLFANVVPECVLFTVTVDARIDWVWGWGGSSSVDIEVEFGRIRRVEVA